jgi:hypothetical protein
MAFEQVLYRGLGLQLDHFRPTPMGPYPPGTRLDLDDVVLGV